MKETASKAEITSGMMKWKSKYTRGQIRVFNEDTELLHVADITHRLKVIPGPISTEQLRRIVIEKPLYSNKDFE